MSLFDLTGRVAIVTGANTGIGAGIALALAQAGADIACVGRTSSADTMASIRATGRRCIEISADLSTNEPIARIISTTLEQLGRIDILINNAGIIRRADALDFSEDDWDSVIGVNLKSAFFLAQAAGRHFRAENKPGRIINIASMLSFQGGVRVASYTASKSGLAGITKLLANEWAKFGINVNAIAPGYFTTNNTAALRADPDRNRDILGRIPAGRWGLPEDLGGAAVFLASDAAAYVHGAIIPVDGGWQAR